MVAPACLRHQLPAVYVRGIDGLPREAIAAVAGALVRSIEATELGRAFGVVIDALISEIGRVDVALANRLTVSLRESVDSAQP